MTFALHPFYELLLKTDIKEKIMIKIKYIQAYKDWSDFDLRISNDAIGVLAINFEDIEKQCDIWKNIAKLSIDLWTDYDYYRQFMFENKYDNPEYNCRLLTLGCIFNDGLWRSVSRPSDEVVQTNIFVYCLYRLISYEMKRNEAGNNKESIACSFCSFDIRYGEDKCSACNPSMEDIRVHKTVMDEYGNKKPDLRTNNKVEENPVEYGAWSSRNGGDESLESKESNDSGIEGKERTSWKCGRCGLLNERSFLTCVACEGLYKDGTWLCDQCKIESSCGSLRCGVCGHMKVEAVVAKQKRPRKDCWRCGSCGDYQSYERAHCIGCGGERTVEGTWVCRRCTFINKCTSEHCGVCDYANKYLSVARCERCTKNKTAVRKTLCRSCLRLSDRWQCSFSHCREWNDSDRKYCLRCHLSRGHSPLRGDSVLQRLDDSGGERSVWLCYRCSTVNNVSSASCVVCDRSRYKRRFCDHCGDYNDGLTHNCDKCYRLLS